LSFWKPSATVLYFYSSPVCEELFFSVGKPTQWIHRDDAAEAHVKAIQRSSVIAGMPHPVFDLGAKPERLVWVMNESARNFGYTGRIEFRDPNDDLEEVEATSVRLDCTRANTLTT